MEYWDFILLDASKLDKTLGNKERRISVQLKFIAIYGYLDSWYYSQCRFAIMVAAKIFVSFQLLHEHFSIETFLRKLRKWSLSQKFTESLGLHSCIPQIHWHGFQSFNTNQEYWRIWKRLCALVRRHWAIYDWYILTSLKFTGGPHLYLFANSYV
jgi:hypothetical protein